MQGTWHNWNSVWQGSLWQQYCPHDQSLPPGRCRIDPGLGAATTRVPAASREDSCPQAILKFQPSNSFDYRVRYEPQLNQSSYWVKNFTVACLVILYSFFVVQCPFLAFSHIYRLNIILLYLLLGSLDQWILNFPNKTKEIHVFN